jgi:hypothetical protein
LLRALTATAHAWESLAWFLDRHIVKTRGNHCDAQRVAHVLVDDRTKDDLRLWMRGKLDR